MASKIVRAGRALEEREPGRGEHVEAAVQKIKQNIFSGLLQPGEPLRETECKKLYSVSRTPFRSALVRLTEEGLLEKLGNITVVRTATPADVIESVTLRYTIESMTASILAGRVRSSDVNQLQLIQDRMGSVIARAKGNQARKRQEMLTNEFFDLDTDFHSKIAELANHLLAAKLLRELRQRVRVFVVRNRGVNFDSERMQVTADQHTQIIEAVKNGQAGTARRRIFDHLKSVAEKCYPWVMEDLQNLDDELRLSRSANVG